MQDSAIDNVIRRFVCELDVLQRTQNGRVTLEEIVQVMAQTEITAPAVAELVRSIYYEGIAHWVTSPNPADYNRPLVLLALNREHPVVQGALANEPLPKKLPYEPDPRTRNFQPIEIDGPPLSEQIIRDRG
jgi:hypothetical protein